MYTEVSKLGLELLNESTTFELLFQLLYCSTPDSNLIVMLNEMLDPFKHS